LYAAPAYAKEKKSKLEYDGEFDGPFEGTSILRLIDRKYDIVCYLYMPKFVSTSLIFSGGKGGTAFNSFAGNISCVRVKKSLW
jgi:hypothetical protein